MTRGIFRQLLKEYRRTLTPAQRRNSYRTKIRWKYPYAGERKLQSIIKAIFSHYADRIKARVMIGENAYPIHTVKRDSFASDIDDYIAELSASIEESQLQGELVSSLNLGPLVIQLMTYIKTFSEKELEDYFFKRFGKPLAYTDPWWVDLQKAWESEFNIRVGGSADAFMYKIRDTVLDYIRNEKSFTDLTSRIRELSTSFTDKQSAFLARDLTGRLNGMMAKAIQTSIGLNYYYWQTAADERVRGRPGGVYASAIPSHWDMDGTICSWIDVSKVSTDFGRTWGFRTARMPMSHPGMAWQCRCIAVPFDLDLLLQVDKELASEGA